MVCVSDDNDGECNVGRVKFPVKGSGLPAGLADMISTCARFHWPATANAHMWQLIQTKTHKPITQTSHTKTKHTYLISITQTSYTKHKQIFDTFAVKVLGFLGLPHNM